MKLYQTLESQLKKEPNYITDNGELKKWVVIQKTQNFDEELIELLLKNDEIKSRFFKEIAGVTVFNQSLFIQFLEQKNYLNDSYTQYKNKIGLTIDGKFLNQRNEVALVWPFKDCILEGGQSREEDKREEIFFNEILAQDEITQLLEPKVLTNLKVFDKDGEGKFKGFTRDAELNKKRGLPEDTITDNLIIKGNNLLALHSLKKEFAGKVKLIYIDPPYNTGSDSFGYNDRFNRSTWLTFMKNRLEIAKELLKNNGLIFVQCDDNEQAYLKVLLDQIFSNENHINTLIPEMSNMSGPKVEHAIKGRRFPKIKEYLHLYGKTKELVFLNIPKQKKEKWDKEYNLIIPDLTSADYNLLIECIKTGDKEEAERIINDKNLMSINEFVKINSIELNDEWLYKNTYRIVASKPNTALRKIALKRSFKNKIAIIKNPSGDLKFIKTDFNRKTETARIELSFSLNNMYSYIGDIWFNIVTTGGVAQEGGVLLKNGKKPEQLLKLIIESATNKNDIVLDYHLGSGTTAAVAHKMKRQYIGIEQLDYGKNDSVIRLQNVINGDKTGISTNENVNWQGGDSFTYFELKKYNQTFIDQIQEAKDTTTLLEIWEEMKAQSFLNYNVDIKKQDEHIEEFKALDLAQQKQHLVEILNKNQLYVNLSSLKDEEFGCTEEEISITQDFYQLK